MAISIEFISEAQQHSQYDWVDISSGENRVGKARCKRNAPDAEGKSVFTIYSVNIYPESAGHGYGREFVDYCKDHFDILIADRVRHSAIGFWEAMGFRDNKDGNWIFCRNDGAKCRVSEEP